jgi:hypothetical protein
MAIYTPTGLKIRFPVPYAFALMARLEPQVTPFRVLMTTEGIELLPNMLRLVTALVCFSLQASFLTTFAACIIATVAGNFTHARGFHVIPGLVRFSTLYSYMNIWELGTIAAALFGLLVCGWQSTLAYCLSCVGGWVLGFLEDYLLAHRAPMLNGIPLVGAELSFISAYRLHAAHLGITDDIALDEHEQDEDRWKGALKRFDVQWPQVAMHFDYLGNE